MAINFTKESVNSGFQSTETVEANFSSLETLLARALSRYGDTPNEMQSDLDMNSQRILNLPQATQPGMPVTYSQWVAGGSTGAEFDGYTVEEQTATAGQTVFTLSNTYTPGISSCRVYINGVYQAPSGYTETDENTITFSEGLELGDTVAFVITSFSSAESTGSNNITYTPAGASAVDSNVQTKLREQISVKDFGAVGNGVADDSSAIQAAVDEGDHIYFPAGTYYIAGATIDVPSNTTLIGDGNASKITCDASGRTDPATDHLFDVSAVENVVIRDLWIDGDRSNSVQQVNGIHVYDSDNVTIENIRFTDHGVIVKVDSSRNVVFDKCYMEEVVANKSGIWAEASLSPVVNLRISNSFFDGCDEEAIDLNGALDECTIIGNHFYNCHTTATDNGEVIDVGDGVTRDINNVVITGNVFDLNDATPTAVWIKQEVQNAVFSNNTVHGGKTGVTTTYEEALVMCSTSSRIVITGNVMHTGERAVSIINDNGSAPAEGIIISNNILRNFAVDGIYVASTAPRSLIISGNTIDGVSATGDGIQLTGLTGGQIIGNEVWDFDDDAIVLSSCGRMHITGNNIRNCGGSGVVNSSANTVINGNSITAMTGNGIEVSQSDAVITSNIIELNGGDGVELVDGNADRCMITSNQLTGNTGYGLDVVASVTDCIVSHNYLAGNTTGAINNGGNLAGSSINADNIT